MKYKKIIDGKHYIIEYKWASFDGVDKFVLTNSRELTEEEIIIDQITTLKK